MGKSPLEKATSKVHEQALKKANERRSSENFHIEDIGISSLPWEYGQHPGNPDMHIVKPVLFGGNVGLLPPHEGGHAYLTNGSDAKLIAIAPYLHSIAQRLALSLERFDSGHPLIAEFNHIHSTLGK